MKYQLIRLVTVAALGLGLGACQSNTSASETIVTSGSTAAPVLTPGPWRGVLTVQGQEIPFLFEVTGTDDKPVICLHNGFDSGGEPSLMESIQLNNVRVSGDSATIRLSSSGAALVVRSNGRGKLKGTWVKYDTKKPRRILLTATSGNQTLFSQADDDSIRPSFVGTWKALFRNKQGKTNPAVVTLGHSGNLAWGSFLTATGGYRFLGGQIINEKEMKLSAFNGNQAFFFTANKQLNGTLKGNFYSSKSGYETFTAVLDPTAKLPKR